MATKTPADTPSAFAPRGLGWIPDLPDYRDFPYAKIARAPLALPAAVDLRAQCSPVEDQGQLGSCTANALVGALELLEKKDGAAFTDLSRLFVYYNERAREHHTHVDSGAYLRDGIKTLARQGVCPESLWPYDIAAFARRPPKVCYATARDHQILAYYRIDGVDQCRQCLAEGFPFVFGFTVYSAFMSTEMARTGILDMPGPDESVQGGHAVMACGYDDAQRRVLVRNSWGAAWGIDGYFTMPYDYIASRNLSDDFWAVRRLEE